MLAIAQRLGIATFCAVLAVSLVLPGEMPVEARGPAGASYCQENGRVFWFIQASDLHVGTSGSTDADNLRWLLTTARPLIKPVFTVVTGDLTDSTSGNIFGYPNGPYQAEWSEYRSIVDASGATSLDYYDLPGNHDAYNDQYFGYYKANAVQGPVYAGTGQVAWTKTIAGIGTYAFVGVNTADNTGAPFSILSPYGDHAGLDGGEITALSSFLSANASANLTFAFGHHPIVGTGNSQDTYLYYGAPEFVAALDGADAVGYQYGHVHDNVQTFFAGTSGTGFMHPGIRYSRVASLGKDSPKSFAVVSVDCDGVNSIVQPVGTWPAVLVTAPVDRYIGTTANPYAYPVPPSAANPIRALVFDAGTVSQVRFRIDSGATWYPMNRVDVSGPQWTGTWDASSATAGEHSIEVQAVGTTTRSHTIKVYVDAGNHAPVASNDAYSTVNNTTLSVAAPGLLWNDTDADGNALTASLVTGPAKGSLVLNANGSFTYTPSGSPTGTDSFTYTASDGQATSNAATVTITLTTPPPSVDTVAITGASYAKKTRMLTVTATSSAAPTATLTVVGYGRMTYSSKKKVYTYQAKVATAPASVTVSSSAGGSATRTL